MFDIQTLILYFTLFISLFFEIFILITYFEVRDDIKFEKAHKDMPRSHYPSVSIIVPAYNEERTVGATINSLLALDYPKDKLSIMLVDDGSTDQTIGEFQKFQSNPQVRILTKENGGKHTALNHALEEVQTDLVGCLDADSFVNSDALRRIIPFFDDKTIMAVTPSIKVHEPETVLQHVQKVEYNWGIFLRRMLSSMGAIYVTPGPFSIFRTQVFRDLGGYKKAHQTEDMEYAMRMQKNRYRIVNSLGAHVYTVTPPGLKPLLIQRARWTYGFLNNAFDYKEMFLNKKYGNIGMFILPIAFISLFSTLYAAGTFLWKMGNKAVDAYSKYRAVGWDINTPTFTFDWYFINTGAISLLTVTIIIMTISLLFVGLGVAEGHKRPGKAVFYYLTIYIFIVPLWITKAVYNTLFTKGIEWR